jgi:diguanylate cyclase (GGDEF)-like protein
MNDAHVDTLLLQAQDHLSRADLPAGVAAAEAAWPLVPADDAPRRLRAGLLLLQLRYRTGSLAAMLDLSHQVLPLLRASGPATQLIDTLRMVALCAADTSRFELSLSSAQEALRLALELDDQARISLATNALACFFERAGDPWQAERLMLEALAQGRAQPEPHPVFVALNNLGAALIGKYYLLRDSMPPDEALEPLRVARPFIEESLALARAGLDPFFKVFTIGNMGEVLVHLGEPDQAARLLDEAEEMAQRHGFEAQAWRVGCSQGELMLLRQQAQRAWDKLSAVQAAAAKADQRATHLRLHHALWRTAVALGRTADALEHLQHYLRLERQRSMTQLRAQSELFVTRMEAEQARQEAQRHHARARALEADVRRDQLTGLGNRREAEARWPELLRAAKAHEAPLAVAMLDLDQFKQVNDQHGHAVGDAVLVALARLLQAHTRASDLVARLGGEEFLIVLPDTEAARAQEVCERLRARVEGHDWGALVPGLAVTVSIGLSQAPPYDAKTLSLRADAALYRAKAAGRNRLVSF